MPAARLNRARRDVDCEKVIAKMVALFAIIAGRFTQGRQSE